MFFRSFGSAIQIVGSWPKNVAHNIINHFFFCFSSLFHEISRQLKIREIAGGNLAFLMTIVSLCAFYIFPTFVHITQNLNRRTSDKELRMQDKGSGLTRFFLFTDASSQSWRSFISNALHAPILLYPIRVFGFSPRSKSWYRINHLRSPTFTMMNNVRLRFGSRKLFFECVHLHS